MSFKSDLEGFPDFNLPKPSRKTRVETYLYDNGTEVAMEAAQSFEKPGVPIEKTVVAIPVAAHQESGAIERALDLYSQQTDANPFTICLHLNYPLKQSGDEIIQTNIDAVSEAQKKYEGILDIRFDAQSYSEPTIGAIRKDLWDGVAFRAINDGLYNQPGDEVIMINNDIDAEYISPHYIAAIQKSYRRSQNVQNQLEDPDGLMPLKYTEVRHAFRWDTHPKTSGGIFWVELAYRQAQVAGLSGGYGAGIVLPLSRYVREGGFDQDAVTHETLRLHGRPLQVGKIIKGTKLLTSPRRYLEKFPTTGYSIWTDETFGSDDACRVDAESVKRDATQDELDEHIFNNIEKFGGWFVAAGKHIAYRRALERNETLSRMESIDVHEHEYLFHISARTELAKRAMSSIVRSPINVDFLPSREEIIESVVKRFAVLRHTQQEIQKNVH